eukprot:7562163-Alexandrium_andersonii.AAC.1
MSASLVGSEMCIRDSQNGGGVRGRVCEACDCNAPGQDSALPTGVPVNQGVARTCIVKARAKKAFVFALTEILRDGG